MNENRDIVLNMRQHPWWPIILDERIKNQPTMVSLAERKMLYWIAKELPLRDDSCFVDAGCFLGGSTIALAAGLRDNSNTGRKHSKILAYDLFIASSSPYTLGLAGRNKKPGDSLVDVFVDNMGDFQPFVTTICGDFDYAPPPELAIDLLFVDVAKSWSLNKRIMTKYFPLLLKNSILIQQDHNDRGAPWVNLTMSYLEDFFEYITDEMTSRVFRLRKDIPEDVLNVDLHALPLDEKMKYIRKSVESENQSDIGRFATSVSAGWFVFEHHGLDSAIEYLNNIDIEQPWKSDVPYIVTVIDQMRHSTHV